MPIKSLAVFCGSKPGKNPIYLQHTIELAKLFIKHDITLIYGGGGNGIMGAIANGVLDNGGRVIGVIPEVLVKWEAQHKSLTELIVVDNMHTRKKKMYELSDAAVIMPGGFGTMDELFEMVTWNQLSIHDKNIYIINSAGFYDHLIAHVKKMQDEEFLYEIALQKLIVLKDSSELVAYL